MIAIVGGRGGVPALDRLVDVVQYCSPGDGGNGDTRRLLSAISGGTITSVFMLARWGSHAQTASIRAACENAGCKFAIWAAGTAQLAAFLIADGVQEVVAVKREPRPPPIQPLTARQLRQQKRQQSKQGASSESSG